MKPIITWLLGENPARLASLTPARLAIACRLMHYRWRILQERYLGCEQNQNYQRLLARLGSVVLQRPSLGAWAAQSCERRWEMLNLLSQFLQSRLHSDLYLRRQLMWIAPHTPQLQLRYSLLLATCEEYFLRSVRNLPLLTYHFIHFLSCRPRSNDLLNLLTEDIGFDLADCQILVEQQQQINWEEHQVLRLALQQQVERQVTDSLGSLAGRWLQLHLQGCSQTAIAATLNLPANRVERLREQTLERARMLLPTRRQP
ncbi:MAG: hypothetical protein HC890_07395 [Chloroflexaceae bacterium]|nr:hypothetical protein [Chloroflexaceae bacterium]